MSKSILRPLFFALCLLSNTGCVHYQMKVDKAISHIQQGKPKAYQNIFKQAKKDSPSPRHLVYLLDQATILQFDGKYKQSNALFLQAEKLFQSKDFISLSSIASNALIAPEVSIYKLDITERFLVNTMLQINFLLSKQQEAAQVEARKLDQKFRKHKRSKKKKHPGNAASFYFSGLTWEMSHNYASAFLDYRRSYRLQPSPATGEALLQAARLSGRVNELPKALRKKHKSSSKGHFLNSEMVLVYQQGWVARKDLPHQLMLATPNHLHMAKGLVPVLEPIPSNIKSIILEVEGVGKSPSRPLFNVTKDMVQRHNDSLFKQGATELLASVVQYKAFSELFGELAAELVWFFRQPDTRHWGLLPESFQVARLKVAPGSHKYRVHELRKKGQVVGVSQWIHFSLKEREKFVGLWRSVL